MGVGGIFFANGWEKLEAGLTATGTQFAQLGAPMPGFWAAAAMLIELIGGTLLIAGLAVPAVGLLLFAEALAVFILTAGDAGLPLTGGNIELIVALGAASVLLSVGGAGRISVDHMVVIKRREAEDAAEFAADTEADEVLAALREPKAIANEPRTVPVEPKSDAATATESPAASPAKASARTSAARSSGASASGSTAKGPVTFPAPSTSDDTGDTGDTGAKPRPRRTKRGTDESTESRSEPPPTPERGDTLVAGRRSSGKPASSD